MACDLSCGAAVHYHFDGMELRGAAIKNLMTSVLTQYFLATGNHRGLVSIFLF